MALNQISCIDSAKAKEEASHGLVAMTTHVCCCTLCCFDLTAGEGCGRVSESTNWSQCSKAAARYHALCCDITPLEPTHQEYADIRDHVIGSQDRCIQK